MSLKLIVYLVYYFTWVATRALTKLISQKHKNCNCLHTFNKKFSFITIYKVEHYDINKKTVCNFKAIFSIPKACYKSIVQPAWELLNFVAYYTW